MTKYFTLEINQQPFQSNITQIQKILIPNNYHGTCEGERTCIADSFQIIQGSLLDEINGSSFVDAVNYSQKCLLEVIFSTQRGIIQKSIQVALLDSRSHLISKRFMLMFIS
ncbi:unnamed protein product [Paramecium octaurelia]|uniref:Uncharacterized protein n=1 Tax=Paramecium octaurelia TaxID=43137 RepID=A0A8S1XWX3_PAROT|nr:unnamed protein product [Paramecium octaurelia]